MTNLSTEDRRKQKRQDPVRILGSGVKNYFRMQKRLLLCFGVFSLLAAAQMAIYSQYDGFKNINDLDNTVAASTSFGNIGHSSSVCVRKPINWARNTPL